MESFVTDIEGVGRIGSHAMGETSGSDSFSTCEIEFQHEDSSFSLPKSAHCEGNLVNQLEEGSCVSSSVEESIQKSKPHWSQVAEFDSGNEVAEVSNVKVFQALQKHPKWGQFFRTFGDDDGILVLGEKIAEGGQAEIYEAHIRWRTPAARDIVEQKSFEFVVKVFKKGTSLRQLQTQWPQGMLQFQSERLDRLIRNKPHPLRFDCDIQCGTLLNDGRFAFIMQKEREDLRSVLDRCMLGIAEDRSSLSRAEVERAMYDVAGGMDQLHTRGIVHRDIKASNVLASKWGDSTAWSLFVAHSECPVGSVGTGFIRAPEILEACKNRNVSEEEELITKTTDIYAFRMMCLEIVAGRLPF